MRPFELLAWSSARGKPSRPARSGGEHFLAPSGCSLSGRLAEQRSINVLSCPIDPIRSSLPATELSADGTALTRDDRPDRMSRPKLFQSSEQRSG